MRKSGKEFARFLLQSTPHFERCDAFDNSRPEIQKRHYSEVQAHLEGLFTLVSALLPCRCKLVGNGGCAFLILLLPTILLLRQEGRVDWGGMGGLRNTNKPKHRNSGMQGEAKMEGGPEAESKRHLCGKETTEGAIGTRRLFSRRPKAHQLRTDMQSDSDGAPRPPRPADSPLTRPNSKEPSRPGGRAGGEVPAPSARARSPSTAPPHAQAPFSLPSLSVSLSLCLSLVPICLSLVPCSPPSPPLPPSVPPSLRPSLSPSLTPFPPRDLSRPPTPPSHLSLPLSHPPSLPDRHSSHVTERRRRHAALPPAHGRVRTEKGRGGREQEGRRAAGVVGGWLDR